MNTGKQIIDKAGMARVLERYDLQLFQKVKSDKEPSGEI